jgi:hypothetical protein
MKLAALALVALLGSTAYARPGGPRQAGPKRKQLRALVMQHFDKNGDGRLEPQERKQAARALKRLAMRMERQQGRKARRAKLIRRFDLNGDGDLGPGEVPPAIADELRPLDQDGDGWLQGNDLP